ncbi:cytochrome P450 [Cantharellus anzutake]|uniref:cytochrome P450 n=1 Tax=Cantharellus anzutake TaxID=1750568 RepID=UPI001907C092|nr:cytochrome P450 [Cantharellus anzutake]KAF8338782.1 cytochrome P450 [Cantharellus anzutake]
MAILSTTAVVITSIVISVVYYMYRRLAIGSRSTTHLLDYPSPPHWFWGHEKAALYDTPYGELYSEWIDEKGRVIRTKGALWHGDILIVADPQALWHIEVKNAYSYQKSRGLRSLIERILGRSILWIEGDEHKRTRSALISCFTEMDGVVNGCAEKLVDSMRMHIINEMDNGVLSPIVNIVEWNSGITLDIIGRVGFDHDFGLGKSSEATELSRTVEDFVESTSTFTGFLLIFMTDADSFASLPFYLSLPFDVVRKQAAIRSHVRKVGRYLADAKVARLMRGESLSEDSKDLLSHLIKASYKEGEALDVDELLDHINTFILTGYETTAVTVSFAVHALAHHTDVQTQLRGELNEFGREPRFDDFQNKDILRLLDAVTKESFRLYPAAPHTERVAGKDDVIPLSGPVRASDGSLMNFIAIKKGQMIVIPRLSINTRRGAWVSLSGWNHLDTFGEGAHMCIGFRLAIFEFKAILAALVKAFVFEEVPNVQTKSHNIVGTLQPSTVLHDPSTKRPFTKAHYLPVKLSLADQH